MRRVLDAWRHIGGLVREAQQLSAEAPGSADVPPAAPPSPPFRPFFLELVASHAALLGGGTGSTGAVSACASSTVLHLTTIQQRLPVILLRPLSEALSRALEAACARLGERALRAALAAALAARCWQAGRSSGSSTGRSVAARWRRGWAGGLGSCAGSARWR